VWNVTSQLHALAGEDNAADHAIREAYAQAYQQWHEIAGYPDTEGWVLAVARAAYQRRRPEAAAPVEDPARPGHDPLSMPGMFRPRVVPDQPAGPRAGDGAAGSWFTPASRSSGAAAGGAGTSPARGISGVFGGRSGTPGNGAATATTQLADEHPAVGAQPGQPGESARPGRLDGFSFGGRRRTVGAIALVIVVALAAAGGVAYLVTGRHPAASHGAAAAHRKPAVQMLAAGRTGTRSAIPWTLLGAGWTLAEISTAAPGPDGTATGSGTVTIYLVDPQGGRYQVQTSSGLAPILLAWSGNAQNALFAVPPSAGTDVTYDVLSVQTGTMSPLPLPPGVTAVGFTRPDGLNILAVSQTTAGFKLERFNLQGAYQATIGSLPRRPGMPGWQPGCDVSSCALSSPGGLFAVWGAAGDEMQLLSNAGGLIRRLAVPDSGSPPSCVPLSWWNGDTVAAYCFAGDSVVGRIWLVPITGATPTALTGPAGSITGAGVVTGTWPGPGAVYATQTDAQQCPGAASGPGGLALATISGGTLQPVSIRGTTNNDTAVVLASDGRLLVLAETSCPGTSSLLWLNPATGATQTVLSAPAGEAGVLAAAPFGMGPTALSVGLAG